MAKAVETLANEMAKQKTDRLPLDETKTLIGALLPEMATSTHCFTTLNLKAFLQWPQTTGKKTKPNGRNLFALRINVFLTT